MIVHPRVIARLDRLRDMNDRIVRSVSSFTDGGPEAEFDLMCECPLESCEQMVRVGARAWQEIADSDGTYVVAHDPVEPLVVTGRGDGWLTAKLHPEARRR